MGTSIIPKKTQDALDFFDQHQATWVLNFANIGVSLPQANAFKASASAARSAFNAQLAAENAARVATLTARTAISDTRRMCGNLINLIKGFADNAANPAFVYGQAQLPMPQAPSPVPAPGTPTNFRVSLLQDGSVTLSWKCKNPVNSSGTIYEVRRAPTGGKAFAFVGATGLRSFNDDTLPSVPGVTYQITAVRSTVRGEPAQFNVNFGVGGDGLTIATIGETTTVPSKLAA